jgi:hypothetical protein
LFINFPAAAVTSADLVSWCGDSPPTPRPDRYWLYRSETKARRWVPCLFCSRSHPKLTNYFWVAWCTSGQRQPRPSRVGGTSGWPPHLLVRIRICWEGGRNNGKLFMLLHSFYWY